MFGPFALALKFGECPINQRVGGAGGMGGFGPVANGRSGPLLILHLVQHDVHHRGQVHTMLSHAGIDPPQLDDFYLEFGRVETAKAYWE